MENNPSQSEKLSDANDTPVRIALVGCGAIAEAYYLPALAARPRIRENLTLIDHDVNRAQKLAADFGAKRYLSDYHEVLDNTDGVIIALPTHLHHPVTMEFMSRGVHVLCEKPLAESFEKAAEMVDHARRTDRILAVNYLQRLIPAFAQVKEWIAEKKYGELRQLKYAVGEEFNWPSVSGFYFNSPVSGRGVLRDRGAHAVDHVCWWLGGKPVLVSSRNDSFGGSEAVACVQFEHLQCSGEIRLSWLGTHPSRFKLVFEKATVIGDVYDYRNIIVEDEDGRRKQMKLNSSEKTKLDIAQKIVDNFVDVIRKGGEPIVSGKNVLESIQFIDECYAAATRLEMPWYDALEVRHA